MYIQRNWNIITDPDGIHARSAGMLVKEEAAAAKLEAFMKENL